MDLSYLLCWSCRIVCGEVGVFMVRSFYLNDFKGLDLYVFCRYQLGKGSWDCGVGVRV